MRLSFPPAPSYYSDSLIPDLPAAAQGEREPRPALEGEVRADVCVVGGGIAGLSTALHLAQRGYKVALLEGRFVGYGASGRSGGQTIFGLAASQQKLVTEVGDGAARQLFDLSIEALDLTQTLIREHHIECDYRPNHVHAAMKPRHMRELHEWYEELMQDYHYQSVSLLDRDQMRTHVNSERYIGGLLDSRSGHLHPLKYTVGLARAAEAAGVTIYENSAALKFREGREVVVETSRGSVRCAHLALCANAYVGGLAPRLARRILGVGTYIIASEPLAKARALELLPSNAAVADMNWILDYFRLSADYRMLFGGRVSYSAVEPPQLAESMRKRMVCVFPSLADVKVAYAWGGYLDITMSRAPDFGRLAPNVFYLQGFSGHGMSLTGLGGKLVAEAIAGTAERFDVFSKIPHREFPGGPLLRRPSLVMAMTYYRLKDLL